jgi:hypothetical protein
MPFGSFSPDDDLPSAGLGFDPAAAPRALVRGAFPGLYNYFTQPKPPPPAMIANPAGKVPPANYDPRVMPAMQDVANIASVAGGGALGAAEGLGLRGALGAARMAPAAMEGLGPEAAMAAARDVPGQTAGSLRTLGEILQGAPVDAATSPAEAATRLTREQRQQVEIERQKAANTEAAAAATAERERAGRAAEAEQALAAQRAQQEQEIAGRSAAAAQALQEQKAKEQAAAETQAAAEAHQKELAGRPLIEKYPGIGGAGWAAGDILAGAVPYAVNRSLNAPMRTFLQGWARSKAAADAALAAGQKATAQAAAETLKGYVKAAPEMATKYPTTRVPMATNIAAATLPVEGSVIPQQLDQYQPQGTRARQEADQYFRDWQSQIPQAVRAYISGLGGATIGRELNPLGGLAPLPGGSQGTINAIAKQFRAPARPRRVVAPTAGAPFGLSPGTYLNAPNVGP